MMKRISIVLIIWIVLVISTRLIKKRFPKHSIYIDLVLNIIAAAVCAVYIFLCARAIHIIMSLSTDFLERVFICTLLFINIIVLVVSNIKMWKDWLKEKNSLKLQENDEIG